MYPRSLAPISHLPFPIPIPNLLRPTLLTLAVWLGVVSVFVAQRLIGPIVGGRPPGPWPVEVTIVEVAYWVPWLLLAPVLLTLVRRFPLVPEAWRANLGIHLSAGVALAAVEAAGSTFAEYAARTWIIGRPEEDGSSVATWAAYTIVALWKYWVFVGVASAFASAKRSRERAIQAARLESQLASARLQALESKLHPHFLFNALHSAAMLTLVDPEAANRLLAELADLLRRTLREVPAAEVSLAAELDLVNRYLGIERIRFPDRLRVSLAIEPEALRARVPNLLLQPLVENAIRHGVAPVSSAGQVTIRGRRAGADLVLDVEDDGPGPPPDFSMGANGGLGLSATAARLALHYPGTNRLELARRPGGGCRVTVTLPFAVA